MGESETETGGASGVLVSLCYCGDAFGVCRIQNTYDFDCLIVVATPLTRTLLQYSVLSTRGAACKRSRARGAQPFGACERLRRSGAWRATKTAA